jgi:ABC-type sugar transport system permease subunit
MGRTLRKSLIWYAFVAPTLILFLIFIAYPTLETFRLSFFREVATRQQFVGLAQYSRLLGDSIFIGAFANTVLLGAVFLLIIIPLGLVLASLLNNLKYAPNFFKVVYFLPQVTSAVAIALVFSYVFNPNWGLVNNGLRALGVDPLPLWLADPRYNLTGARAMATIMDGRVYRARLLHVDLPRGLAGSAQRVVRRGGGGRRKFPASMVAHHNSLTAPNLHIPASDRRH